MAAEMNKSVSKPVLVSAMAYVIVATLCQIPWANAQTSGQAVLTLDEAILLARSNNRELKQYALDVDRQREAQAESKTHLYPRLDTSVLAAELVRPINFTVSKGQFGTFSGTG